MLIFMMTNTTLGQYAVILWTKTLKLIKKIENFAMDVHFHHIQIPVNFLKLIKIPAKAMETLKSYVKNQYQQSTMYYMDEQRGNMVDKHQALLVATLIKESSNFILNTWSDQLATIQNNLWNVTSTLTASNTRQELLLHFINIINCNASCLA